jgi:hypothetical protein
MRSSILALSVLAACAGALLAAGSDPDFRNLTAEQARTLVALARDFDAQSEGRQESAYTACIGRYDADAADSSKRAQIDESFALIDGATRRMGYKHYADITDDYERLRLAKMLGERGWLKQFRSDLVACLGAAQPAAR